MGRLMYSIYIYVCVDLMQLLHLDNFFAMGALGDGLDMVITSRSAGIKDPFQTGCLQKNICKYNHPSNIHAVVTLIDKQST